MRLISRVLIFILLACSVSTTFAGKKNLSFERRCTLVRNLVETAMTRENKAQGGVQTERSLGSNAWLTANDHHELIVLQGLLDRRRAEPEHELKAREIAVLHRIASRLTANEKERFFSLTRFDSLPEQAPPKPEAPPAKKRSRLSRIARVSILTGLLTVGSVSTVAWWKAQRAQDPDFAPKNVPAGIYPRIADLRKAVPGLRRIEFISDRTEQETSLLIGAFEAIERLAKESHFPRNMIVSDIVFVRTGGTGYRSADRQQLQVALDTPALLDRLREVLLYETTSQASLYLPEQQAARMNERLQQDIQTRLPEFESITILGEKDLSESDLKDLRQLQAVLQSIYKDGYLTYPRSCRSFSLVPGSVCRVESDSTVTIGFKTPTSEIIAVLSADRDQEPYLLDLKMIHSEEQRRREDLNKKSALEN